MYSEKLLHTLKLANGLTVTMFDQTRVYFGDYHQVKIAVVCSFADRDDIPELGCPDEIDLHTLTYTRTLEKMGVPAAAVEQVIRTLLDDFHLNALPYISTQAFPIKMIQNHRAHKNKRVRKYSESGS